MGAQTKSLELKIGRTSPSWKRLQELVKAVLGDRHAKQLGEIDAGGSVKCSINFRVSEPTNVQDKTTTTYGYDSLKSSSRGVMDGSSELWGSSREFPGIDWSMVHCDYLEPVPPSIAGTMTKSIDEEHQFLFKISPVRMTLLTAAQDSSQIKKMNQKILASREIAALRTAAHIEREDFETWYKRPPSEEDRAILEAEEERAAAVSEHDVRQLFHKCGLSVLADVVIDAGYDDLDALRSASQAELQEVGVSRVAFRRLQTQLRNVRSSLTDIQRQFSDIGVDLTLPESPRTRKGNLKADKSRSQPKRLNSSDGVKKGQVFPRRPHGGTYGNSRKSGVFDAPRSSRTQRKSHVDRKAKNRSTSTGRTRNGGRTPKPMKFEIGGRVSTFGLRNAKFNNKEGTLQEYHKPSNRWMVKLDGLKVIAVREKKLKLLEREIINLEPVGGEGLAIQDVPEVFPALPVLDLSFEASPRLLPADPPKAGRGGRGRTRGTSELSSRGDGLLILDTQTTTPPLPGDAGEAWKCDVCGEGNPATRNKCEFCDVARPGTLLQGGYQAGDRVYCILRDHVVPFGDEGTVVGKGTWAVPCLSVKFNSGTWNFSVTGISRNRPILDAEMVTKAIEDFLQKYGELPTSPNQLRDHLKQVFDCDVKYRTVRKILARYELQQELDGI